MKFIKTCTFLLICGVGILLLYKKFSTYVIHKDSIKPNIVKHFKLQQLDLNQIESSDDLITWLEQEEKDVWCAIEKATGLSYGLCQRLKKDQAQAYLDDLAIVKENYGLQKSLSHETITLIKSVMNDFLIDPNTLKIIAWDVKSAAAATDEILFVNETKFNKLTHNAKKFVIGHELVHYLKKDHSTNFFVKKYTATRPQSNKSPSNRLIRLQELRADILSSIKDPSYSKGNVIFFKDHIYDTSPNYGPPCHPKNYLRLALGEKIAKMEKYPKNSLITTQP